MPDAIAAAERLERLVLEELHAAAPDVVREEMGLRLEDVGTGLVSLTAHEPGILKLGFREAYLRENFAPSR